MPAGALARVYVAAEHAGCVADDGLRPVGEEDLGLRPLFFDDVPVVIDIVNAREGVHPHAERLAVLLEREHVAVGVDAALVQRVHVEEVVAHLIGGIGEHEHDLFRPAGDAAQADGEAVAGEDGEHDAHRAAAELGAHIRRDVVHRGVVAVRPGHDALRHGDDVAVVQLKAVLGHGALHTVRHQLDYVVAFAYYRGTDTPGNDTAHVKNLHRN